MLGEEVFEVAVTTTTWTKVTIPNARYGKGSRVSMMLHSKGEFWYSHLPDGSAKSPCPGIHEPIFEGTADNYKDVVLYVKAASAASILAVTITR